MHILILSGRSGSGKTISLNALEDFGFYCVDNLPVNMLPELIRTISNEQSLLAVSIDARNLPKNIADLKKVIAQVKKPGLRCDIVYLDAQDRTILTRFSETKRKHPLTNSQMPLQEALKQEQLLLSPLSNMADLTIDTTRLSKHQLIALIRERVAPDSNNQLQVLFKSFGFKHGMPCEADFIFDVRCLPNPYWQPSLRAYSGKDQPIEDFLEGQPEVNLMIEDILNFLETWIPKFKADNRSYLTVGIGCTGGQHRSVYVAEKIVQSMSKNSNQVQIRHRDLSPTP